MRSFGTTPYSSEPRTSGAPAVTLRPLAPDDAYAVYALHTRLRPESIYARFLQYRIPTLREFTAICTMAPAQGQGVVAETQGGRRQIVGLAYYVRGDADAQSSAELAIVIEDRYQGRGLGRLLWQGLHQQAAADRLSELRVIFSTRNRRILRLIEGGDYPYERCNDLFGGGDLDEYRVVIGGRQDASRVRRLLAKVAPQLF